ncbi:transcription initiation factor IIE subunit beta isoform X1 [Lepisosteus oculatus]|uniref:transcription initiation factor IIE subunit beta isoform X1 n=1 Tax=Lepisosteus oculatus TaxID=7918 RepID=UPI0035F514D1
MDPALLRETELFKKRALSTPAVEKRPAFSDSSSSKKKKAKYDQAGSSGSKHGTDSSNGSFNLKALSGSSGYKFGVLAKIVNYMKTRHQRGDTYHLTLDEILDETKLLDIGLKQKQWLMTEALASNPKIEVRDGKYGFKPKYNLKDKKALLRLLDKHDQLGLGGVLLDDVEEGLPNAQKAIKALGDQVVFVTRPDKKKILFYNDKNFQFVVDEGTNPEEKEACFSEEEAFQDSQRPSCWGFGGLFRGGPRQEVRKGSLSLPGSRGKGSSIQWGRVVVLLNDFCFGICLELHLSQKERGIGIY